MTFAQQIFSALSDAGDDIVLSDGEGDVSGSALLAEVRRWQLALERLCCRRVGVALDNGRHWVALDLALLANGCVSVPIPSFFTEAQTQHVVAAAGIDTIIAQALLPSLPNASIQHAQGSVWHSLKLSDGANRFKRLAPVSLDKVSTRT